MGDGISAFLSAIPAAATSPLAFVAYLATLAAWTFIAYRVRRFSILMEKIESLPEADRRPIIEVEFRNAKIPPQLTARQYLDQQRQSYVLYAFFALCGVVLVLAAMTFYTAAERRDRSDNFIEKVLGAPSSQFQSSMNVLSNGPQMIKDTAVQIGPPPSSSQLADIVDRLVQSGMRDGGQINQRLHQMFGGGKLQDVSTSLNRAASVLDHEFEPLADCYRKLECGKGNRFVAMCNRVDGILQTIDEINKSAGNIEGVTLNTTGAPPMFGDGSIDIYFDAVNAPNISYLVASVCPQARR